MLTGSGPAWLSDWHAGQVSLPEALGRFDDLPDLSPDELVGRWRGGSLPTGHPLDGLLEALGWHGKSVESPERVHPLLFRSPSGRVAPLDPAWMPTGIALGWPAFARSRMARSAFAALHPLLRTRRPAAKLRRCEHRGRRGTALIYNDQPIADHLRRAGDDQVIGLMERNGMAGPFFFLLVREVGKPMLGPGVGAVWTRETNE